MLQNLMMMPMTKIVAAVVVVFEGHFLEESCIHFVGKVGAEEPCHNFDSLLAEVRWVDKRFEVGTGTFAWGGSDNLVGAA